MGGRIIVDKTNREAQSSIILLSDVLLVILSSMILSGPSIEAI
jgi:hypothetical protein